MVSGDRIEDFQKKIRRFDKVIIQIDLANLVHWINDPDFLSEGGGPVFLLGLCPSCLSQKKKELEGNTA